MNRALGGVLVVSWLLLGACGGDDGGDDVVDASDACREGCVATLAAGCENGPATQPVCESDCTSLESGSCSAEYAALQSCAKGKDITCSAQGLPTIAACTNETVTFVGCLD